MAGARSRIEPRIVRSVALRELGFEGGGGGLGLLRVEGAAGALEEGGQRAGGSDGAAEIAGLAAEGDRLAEERRGVGVLAAQARHLRQRALRAPRRAGVAALPLQIERGAQRGLCVVEPVLREQEVPEQVQVARRAGGVAGGEVRLVRLAQRR